RMYGHGITTLMLTEMLGMGSNVLQNTRIHTALEKALALILKAQQVPKKKAMQGGWRYAPNSTDSDLSVSVWQLMALRSAKNDGMEIPGESIDAAVDYLKASSTAIKTADGGIRNSAAGFSYMPGSTKGTFAMTAAGLLALQVCGRYESPLVKAAARWLLLQRPRTNERFFYYGIYYYAQGMHQVGGEYAETARRMTSDLLLRGQRSNGSWIGYRAEERNIGEVYSTSLAILSLSVRYHYLPIYQR
ncbi:MAG: prenyltransferase/squalene oxidase repeat-containing protein, partial [Planctomycetota bacterium]